MTPYGHTWFISLFLAPAIPELKNCCREEEQTSVQSIYYQNPLLLSTSFHFAALTMFGLWHILHKKLLPTVSASTQQLLYTEMLFDSRNSFSFRNTIRTKGRILHLAKRYHKLPMQVSMWFVISELSPSLSFVLLTELCIRNFTYFATNTQKSTAESQPE